MDAVRFVLSTAKRASDEIEQTLRSQIAVSSSSAVDLVEAPVIADAEAPVEQTAAQVMCSGILFRTC